MARNTISVGHVSDNATVVFDSHQAATNAWLLLASMKITAAIWHGADGWLPNTETTAWGAQTGLYWNIPDISLTETPVGYRIESAAMRCELAVTKAKAWKSVAALITEYMDRCESGCWEVA